MVGPLAPSTTLAPDVPHQTDCPGNALPRASRSRSTAVARLAPSATTESTSPVRALVAAASEPRVTLTGTERVRPPKVACTVRVPAPVAPKAVRSVPSVAVVPLAGVKLPPGLAPRKLTAWPPTGLPLASRTVRVRHACEVPFAVTLARPETKVLVATAGAPATKETTVSKLVPPTAKVKVLASARLERSVAAKRPLTSVAPEVGAKTLLPPLLPSVTAPAGTGLPDASLTRSVSVVAALPSATATLGEAESTERAGAGGPGRKATLALVWAACTRAVTFWASATLLARVAPANPLASVVGSATSVPPVPVVKKVTGAPTSGLARASVARRVKTITFRPLATAVVGAAERVQVASLVGPATNVALACSDNASARAAPRWGRPPRPRA